MIPKYVMIYRYTFRLYVYIYTYTYIHIPVKGYSPQVSNSSELSESGGPGDHIGPNCRRCAWKLASG